MDRNDPNMSHLTANADNALSRRDYHAAAALYLKALERPSIRPYLRAALLTNLGLAWQYLDEVEKATACFEDAVAANPRLASARTGLGAMYARRARHADPSPDAFAKVVDRLLASPHYGERWGRHWLDVARYADTKGYVFFQESDYPWAYTYRDYVLSLSLYQAEVERRAVAGPDPPGASGAGTR